MTLLSHSLKVRHLILAAALTTGPGFVNPANAEIAFLVDLNSRTAIDLGNLGGAGSYANGINDAGQVVGYSSIAEGNDHAFITGPNGRGMRDLGTLGGNWSQASGINDTGQVVGYSLTADRTPHAFITGPDGVGMRDLGTLGGNASMAYGINDAGQVVGGSLTAEGSGHAFITGPNGVGMTDLNSLVELPPGIVLATATGINNEGQVLITSPIPEPEAYALMLAGLVLVGAVIRRKEIL
ncbi:MAG: PEP-CTERM sorting domain-containing protein [Nitrosospira multiformis]|nr:PEP-CTERM sorting domain-containing protein [Nitrosospira multiformis]